MTERLRRLYRSCGERLAQFHLESIKTFNLISLVAAFPKRRDMRTALELQQEREELARSRFQECSGDLLRQIDRV